MDVEVAIAGLICVALALGHTTIGAVWVLPNLTEERMKATPFGPPSMTVAMLRATWYLITVFVLAIGALLMSLAWSEDPDPRILLLRFFAAMWAAAAVVATSIAASRVRDLRHLLRLPVPLLFIAVALLCWKAST